MSGAAIQSGFQQAGGWARQPKTSWSAMVHSKAQATLKQEASKSKELALQHALAAYQEALPGMKSLWIQGFWVLILCIILCICSYTCIVYYMYFFVIFTVLLWLSLLLTWWVVPVGTPAKIDSALPDWVLTRKICGNFCKVHKNNKNILHYVWTVC